MFKKLSYLAIFLSSAFIYAQEEEVVVTGSYIAGALRMELRQLKFMIES